MRRELRFVVGQRGRHWRNIRASSPLGSLHRSRRTLCGVSVTCSHWQKSCRFSYCCSADFGPRLPANQLSNNKNTNEPETFANSRNYIELLHWYSLVVGLHQPTGHWFSCQMAICHWSPAVSHKDQQVPTQECYIISANDWWQIERTENKLPHRCSGRANRAIPIIRDARGESLSSSSSSVDKQRSLG